MNVITYEKISPNRSFPWFDDYSQHNTFCKVYNDGSCYVAVPSSLIKRKKHLKSHSRDLMDDLFDQYYLEAIDKNLSGERLQEFILKKFQDKFPEKWGLVDFVERKILRVVKNLSARKKRFRRKAYLNPWNYFVTFTYDDDLQDEDGFKKRLRKSLSNLHTRRGWLYMGVFERAPETGRLHFHAIMYIPEGQMVGNIYERRDYSTKQHKMQITHCNDFFEKSLGRNDFEDLSEVELRRGTTMQYLLKYLEKTDERIIYSRGIPTEFFKEINDDDVICEMIDFVKKFVLFNDVIDYEEDVKHNKKRLLQVIYNPLPS